MTRLQTFQIDHTFKISSQSPSQHHKLEVSSRLIKCIRKKDVLARLGGDEFTIILEGTSNIKDISFIADKIIDIMKEPIKIASNMLHIATSI